MERNVLWGVVGSIVEVLDAVQCTVVSALGNRHFDAYVLSESSLFVYPSKIVIKTCGTTQLLKSIPPLLAHGHDIGLSVCGCRYTRGNFIFPKAQPFPHTSFEEEVMYLEQNLPSKLCYRKASVMPCEENSTTHSWHVFAVGDEHHMVNHMANVFTIEVCMTQLDRALAQKFYLRPGGKYSGDVTGREMSMATGINDIIPNALVCDFGFDPCGYSMNGLNGIHYSTIHVTPEDGYSYASFEVTGLVDESDGIEEILEKVVRIFRPATMSVSTTRASQEMVAQVKNVMEQHGLARRTCTSNEFPAAGRVVFQTFTSAQM